MKINIFGVGRSGTTALELYFAYWLAQKYGRVRVNNEPYSWMTRKGPMSYEGQYIFINELRETILNQNISSNHRHFIERMNVGNPAIVSKFVRGSMFADTINTVMKPDLTVIVIRDLIDVMNSLKAREWDFLTLSNRDVEKELVSNELIQVLKSWDAQGKFPFSMNSDMLQDDLMLNGLLWYVTNSELLDKIDGSSAIFLNFRDIELISQSIVENTLKVDTKGKGIRNELFFDKNLQKNYPLKDSRLSHITNKILAKVNERKFNAFLNKGIEPKFMKMEIGSDCRLGSKPNQFEAKLTTKKTINPIDRLHHPLLEQLNDDIFRRLEKKQTHP